jgi:hypothetical protein
VPPRLEPEEALTGPLYAVAGLLILVPLVDLVMTVPPPEYGNLQWRFTAMGLLSGATLLPIVGLALGLVISGYLKQRTIMLTLVIVCLTMAVALLTLSFGFLIDVKQLRFTVPDETRAAFNSAWRRAVIKLLLSGATLAYMGWLARRMIPGVVRKPAHKPVHVVSK